jgi:hypothetical protein
MREFSISTSSISVAGATTMVYIAPGAAPNPNLEFMRFWVGQAANATSAQQRIQLASKASIFPTLVTTTPAKLKPSDPNASYIVGGTAGAIGTAGINASAEGAGVQALYWEDAFNVLNGWLHVPTPAETRVMPAGLGLGLELYFPVAPANLTVWVAGLVYREV